MHARSRESHEAEFREPSRLSRGGPALRTAESVLLELQRTVGNAAVAKLLADRAQRSAPPRASAGPATVGGARDGGSATAARPAMSVPVQRRASINGNSVGADVPNPTPKMVEWINDRLDRDYESMDEFKQHAAGDCDHLGNLPGPVGAGVWVRFSRTGVNVLGERHTAVTLPDVIRAVSGNTPPRFLYEPFSTDDFSQEPHTEAAYRVGLGEVRDKFGMDEGADWRPHALESVYPKMGELFTELLGYLESGKLAEISESQDARYLGTTSSRYLKIAWAYGKDVQKDAAAKPARKNLAAKRDKLTGRLEKLAHRRDLDSFIGGLSVDTNLADRLLEGKGERYQDPVRSYVKAVVRELRERGAAGAVPDGGGSEGLADQKQSFRDQRDAGMAETAKKADGVRYVGVGASHLDAVAALLRQGPGEYHFYVLTEAGPYPHGDLQL